VKILERASMRDKSILLGIFTIIFTIAVYFPLKLVSQETVTAKTPLIIVNGKTIKLGSAIIAFTKIQQSGQPLNEKTIFSQVLQQLINEELLSQKVTKESDLTKLALEHEKRSAKAAQMVSKVIKNFPTKSLVETAYNNLKDNAQNALEYNASHILLKTEKEAQEILGKLSKKEDFKELARKNSIGPSGKNGGNLSWFDLSNMVPEFSTAVMVLEEGKVSQPVKTKFGWHVIKLNETREKKIPAFSEVSSQIASDLRQKKLNEYLETLSKTAKIDFVGKNISPNEITNVGLLEKLDE
jgi:peptidyl-prolyl cis-trans isomerase C